MSTSSPRLVDIGGKRVLQYGETGPALATGQDTNDLISAAWEHEASGWRCPPRACIPISSGWKRASPAS